MSEPANEQPSATTQERPGPESDATPRDQTDRHSLMKPGDSTRWYQDPSKVVGVLGFVLALGTLGERMWVRHQEEVDRQLQQLRDVTAELADIQGEYLDLVVKAPTNLYARGVGLNTKRQMHIQTAIALLKSDGVRAQTSAQILGTLANELSNDGRYQEAKDLFEEALKAPGIDDTTELALRRSLGQLYRIPNTAFANLDTSRNYFQQALAKLDKRKDDAGHLVWAETILSEASMEVAIGDKARAKELAAKARERIGFVKVVSPQKMELERLATAYERGEQFAQTQMSSLPPVTTAQAQLTASSPSTEAATNVQLELWAPVPGQVPAAEMDISIDGQSLGQLANMTEKRSVTLTLTPGVHRFSLTNMKAYLVDAAGTPRLIAENLACNGVFDRAATATVLKINVGNGPHGMMCSVQ